MAMKEAPAKKKAPQGTKPRRRRPRGVPAALVAALLVIAVFFGGLFGFVAANKTNTYRVQLDAAQERINELENLLTMMKAADNVSTGSVTFAARDSDFEDKAIKKGEVLALENGKLLFTDTDIRHATVKLAKSIINTRKITGKELNFITILYGEGVTEEEAQAVSEAIRAKVGDEVDITVVNGGQPVYYYYLSVE